MRQKSLHGLTRGKGRKKAREIKRHLYELSFFHIYYLLPTERDMDRSETHLACLPTCIKPYLHDTSTMHQATSLKPEFKRGGDLSQMKVMKS
jgi:hypothetical protein